jgi:hypothetical protein
MGMLSRLRERGEAFVAQRLAGEAVAFTAQIPGSAGPLCEMRVEAESQPEGDGERVRLRAHFRMHLRRAASAPQRGAPRAALPARVGRWIERRLASRVVGVLAAPLIDRDINTWVEVRASSAALDDGSRALVPDKLGALGVDPVPGKPFQSWAGALGGAKPGFAMLTLVQLDKDHLPPNMRQALGPKPFQLSATLVNVVEES